MAQAINAPAAFVFALTPALANPDPVDYNSNEGMKLYKSATEKLNHTFDGETGSLRLFLQALQQRADAFGWASILTVPDDQNIGRNLITEYGRVSMANVVAHAAAHVHTHTRDAQNSAQLFTCIYDSLSLEALLKVSTDSAAYRLVSPTDHTFVVASGAAFLKLLITRCTVDTRSTVATIRRTLSALDQYMLSVNCDIEKFNLHVRVQRDALMSRGETSSDLLTNLFTAYEAVEDKVFHDYMVGQQDQYHDGRVDFCVDSLMDLALNKFKMLVESKRWNLPSVQDAKLEAQIVALTAKLEYFKANKSLKEVKNDKREKARKAKLSKKWAWKLVPPKEDDPKTKTVDTKEYHWCSNHASWTVHTAKECNMSPQGMSPPVKIPKKPKDKSAEAIALSTALASIMEGNDDDDDSNQGGEDMSVTG